MAFMTKETFQKPKVRTVTVPDILDDDGNPVEIRFKSLSGLEAEALENVNTNDSNGMLVIRRRIAESLVDEHGNNYLTPEDVAIAPFEHQTAILKAMVSSFQGIVQQGEGLGGVPSAAMPTVSVEN
jgi:hypothetical protein